MKELAAFYIGRFEPPHLGHISTIEEISNHANVKKIVIGIGSSQYTNQLSNPFSGDERELMLKQTLTGLKSKVEIVQIPDLNNHGKWVEHVESLSPKFDLVFSGNPLVKHLFQQSGYEVRPTSSRYPDISATLVRERMIQGKNWQELVHPETAKILKKIRGSQRLRSIYLRHLLPAVTADVIIDYKNEGLVLITRRNEPFANYLALPGGFMETGKESIEQTAVREAWEETGLEINPTQLQLVGVYSDPGRDPRGHTISTAFYAKVDSGNLKAGDDAKYIHPIDHGLAIPQLAFDHNRIVQDSFRFLHN